MNLLGLRRNVSGQVIVQFNLKRLLRERADDVGLRHLCRDSGLAKITPDGLPSASTNNVTPSFSPDGRQILFLGGDSFNPRITLMDRDGSRAHFLTSRPIFPQNTPVFSPEGTAIAFAGRLTAGQEIYTINLMNADGSQVRAIPNTTGLDVRSPRFSRDGRQIMFSTFLYSETRIKRDIYLIDVSGSALRGLTHDGESFAPAFTGSGRIVFVSTKTGGSDLYVMDANGQNATRLTSTAADTFDGSPDSQ